MHTLQFMTTQLVKKKKIGLNKRTNDAFANRTYEPTPFHYESSLPHGSARVVRHHRSARMSRKCRSFVLGLLWGVRVNVFVWKTVLCVFMFYSFFLDSVPFDAKQKNTSREQGPGQFVWPGAAIIRS